MMQGKTALVLINEHSRKGKENAPLVTKELHAQGIKVIQRSPESPEDLSRLVLNYQDQIDMVIVGGGDGTLNAIADILVETKLPLGVIPLGTANDLARTLEIPANIVDACKIIGTGTPYPIDLGWVNGKHFFNVASLGLSVKITQKLSKDLKRRWGIFAYAATAIQVLRQSRPWKAEISFEGESIKVKTIQIAIGNGRYYGGGLSVAHDATIDDQRLDLYSLEIQHWWQIFGLPSALLGGNHRQASASRYLCGKKFEINTLRPHPINTDGEITTTTPATFKVITQAISVILNKKPSYNR